MLRHRLLIQSLRLNLSVCFEFPESNQRVIVRILDVNDEPPYFINRPLPMQAVVELNALHGKLVYKLQARDRDTDHNIHYYIARDRSKSFPLLSTPISRF